MFKEKMNNIKITFSYQACIVLNRFISTMPDFISCFIVWFRTNQDSVRNEKIKKQTHNLGNFKLQEEEE